MTIPRSDENTSSQKFPKHVEPDSDNRPHSNEEQDVTRSQNKIRHLKTPTVAFLGPDGSGKSTLVKNIQTHFELPVRTFYMGLYQRPAKKRSALRIPGPRLLFNIMKQWHICLLSHYHKQLGRLVLFDRYTYDSLLPSSKPMNFYRRVRQFLLVKTCPNPDLVILLDAPGQTLFDRKGEHSAEHLEVQRQAYRQLQNRLPQLIIVDASQSFEDVYQEVTAALWTTIGKLNRKVTHA